MSASAPHGKWKIADNTQFPRWRRDGRELFFLSRGSVKAAAIETTPSGLRVTDIKTLFTQPKYIGGNYPYDVSHDGQHFLFQVPDETVSEPLTLMVNWSAVLER
jgi:hypothetical protein